VGGGACPPSPRPKYAARTCRSSKERVTPSSPPDDGRQVDSPGARPHHFAQEEPVEALRCLWLRDRRSDDPLDKLADLVLWMRR
jgi:hypothetical protein